MKTSIIDFEILQQMIEELSLQKISLRSHFLPESFYLQLRDLGISRMKQGAFKAAEMGRGSERHLEKQTRGDSTLWLESVDAPILFALLEEIRLELNESLYLGLQNFECHLACYPPGAGYALHLDQAKGHQPLQGERVITFVAYLNPQWSYHSGGEIHFPSLDLKVLPQGGSLVLFDSQGLEHEVLPSSQERWSLTGWFRRSRL